MGNIIRQITDDERAYTVNDTGDLSLINTLNAKTGVFDNTSWFKQNVIVDGTVDGVDIAALKTSVDGMSSAGQGTFGGKTVSALSFTGTSGNFDSLSVATTGTFGSIKTSLLDINGNITSSVGPKYITASTSSGLKLENGSTVSNGYVQVNSDGSISIIPYNGKSLVLGGNMTGAGSINAGTGTFSSLNTSGALSAGAGTLSSLTTSGALSAGAGTFSSLTTSGALSAGVGTFSSLNLSSGLTGTSGTFSGLLTANGGLTLPSTSILTLSGSMTGAGNINAGDGKFSSLTTSGVLSAGAGTFSDLLTASNGLKIGPSTSANNWKINENTNGDLCFFRNGNAFACINNAGNLYAPSAAIKAVAADLVTFPLKFNWSVNDKFVMKVGTTNNVSRGTVTAITPVTFTNTISLIKYNLTNSDNITTSSSMPLSTFNTSTTLRADNSNGVPDTSSLRWV